MSGGSLDYAYGRIEQIAETLSMEAKTVEHRAMAQHLFRVAEVLHDIEWVLSGDYSSGDELEKIYALLHPTQIVEAALDAARQARDDLDRILKLYER